MVYEPPPNPADWICDALPPRHIPESPNTRHAVLSRQEEPMTWESVRAARNAYGRHRRT
jgi:hypothetical protein